MSSTVIIAAGAAASLGPVGLGLLAGGAVAAALASRYGREHGQCGEEVRYSVAEAWRHTRRELEAEASEITSTSEREKVITEIHEAESRYIRAVEDGDSSSAGQVVRGLREKIFRARTEELVLRDKQQRLLGTLGGLEEDKVFIPPSQHEESENAQLVNDICDFGMRLSFFGKGEADKVRPLILEAKEGASTLRLKAIRDQLKMIYGRLCEREAMTRIYRQDCVEFLAAIRNAQGTEELCAKIQDALSAEYISRETCSEIYKSVCEVIRNQAEGIVNSLLASRLGAELEKVGYQLLDEAGNPVMLTEGEIHTLDTPYDGYKLRVKTGHDRTIAARLVRVAGNESEYQRQKDTETGQKVCGDLAKIRDALTSDGLIVNDIMRKEPGEEQLDIVVEKSSASRASRRKHRTKPQLYQEGRI